MPATKENLGHLIDTKRPPLVRPDTPRHEATKTMTFLGQCGDHAVGISYFQGHSAWARHPKGDELFIVLQGHLRLLTVDETGEDSLDAGPNTLIRIPAGLWHAQIAKEPVAQVFLTVGEGSESSIEKPRNL